MVHKQRSRQSSEPGAMRPPLAGRIRSSHLVLTLLLVAGGSCGTRAEDTAQRPPPGSAAAPAKPADPPAPAGEAAARSSEDPQAPSSQAPAVVTTRPAGISHPAGAAQPPQPNRSTPRASAGGPGTAVAAAQQSAATPSGAAREEDAKAVPSTPATPESSTPITVASVGTLSGVAGAVLGQVPKGAQVWAKWVNRRGGLNGHPVNLILYDDGGDPARHRAQVQDAVERRSAVAFVASAEALTGHSSVEYINDKRVPVVGVDLGETWPASSPMYFPQSSFGDAFNRSSPLSTAQQVLREGKRKLGTIVCAEAQGCADLDRIWNEMAAQVGFKPVYRAKASLAQPDYTAECLAAKNAGVQTFFVLLDTASLGRLSAQCARQLYRPTYAIVGQGVEDHLKKNSNLEGTVAFSPVFPYIQSGTPATDEYQAAFKAFAGSLTSGPGPTLGWTSGKLLEKVGPFLSEPVTSQQILHGLWSLRGDTLGGLTAPLTFNKDQPPQVKTCWFDMTIRNGAWVSPDGFKMHCA